MLDRELARTRVQAGIALLDEHGPGDWRDLIDVKLLDLSNGDQCIVGQVFGDYMEGLDELGLSIFNDRDVDHGFMLAAVDNGNGPTNAPDEDFAALTDMWIVEAGL